MALKNNIITSWLNGIRKQEMPALGPRELDVLDQLWRHASLSVQQLHNHLSADLSLNTVQSTLERLHRKGLVKRNKQGRAFIYSAGLTRSEVVSRVLNDLARDVGRGDLAPIISGFAEFMSADDANIEQELLRVLETAQDANAPAMGESPEQRNE